MLSNRIATAALAAAVAAAFSLPVAAQQGGEKSSGQAASSTKDTKDTASSSKASGKDARAMRDLAQANLAEIETGKLAAGKAQNPEVKKFAQHMVDEHGKLLQELQQLASSKGVKLPEGPDAKHKAAMKMLEKADGDDFDKRYMDQMVKDHQQTLRFAQRVAKDAKDPELKAAVEKASPHVKEHLAMAQKLSGKGEGASSGGSRPAGRSASQGGGAAK